MRFPQPTAAWRIVSQGPMTVEAARYFAGIHRMRFRMSRAVLRFSARKKTQPIQTRWKIAAIFSVRPQRDLFRYSKANKVPIINKRP